MTTPSRRLFLGAADFALTLFVAGLLVPGGLELQVVPIKDGPPLLVLPLEPSERFTLHYFHSVENASIWEDHSLDEIGYLDKMVSQAKKLAQLPDDARVLVYRRTKYPDDNLFNTATRYNEGHGALIPLELPGSINHITTGFYYLWQVAAMSD